ncbi:unnamed protein product [Bursaphelenchus okinawaensis]|uniref:Uncharacterized protein n=1 Tax=Bursaphelenchus okinawaensis TaxID=465554 RepID=A0A811JU00_9BILA|nr:unnamed protein product [Bursaphelenchus okinawaensis]CAG9082948.1 unnamed protein product [Bursaphelenchus okinawaensis]
MVLSKRIVTTLRNLCIPCYRQLPLASEVVAEYIRNRDHPSWTSFFLPYKCVQDDLYGEKHFNFPVDSCNYHILRVGCYPYVKYHCTKRAPQDLNLENNLFKVITALNLGIPCLLYGIAAIFLIKHTDYVHLKGQKPIPIHFLILEDHQ